MEARQNSDLLLNIEGLSVTVIGLGCDWLVVGQLYTFCNESRMWDSGQYCEEPYGQCSRCNQCNTFDQLDRENHVSYTKKVAQVYTSKK